MLAGTCAASYSRSTSMHTPRSSRPRPHIGKKNSATSMAASPRMSRSAAARPGHMPVLLSARSSSLRALRVILMTASRRMDAGLLGGCWGPPLPLISAQPPSPSKPAAREPVGDADEPAEPSPRLARYARPPGILVRPLPDLEIAFAYNPADRALSCLNLSAWAAFELCDGRIDLESDYRDLVRAKLRPAQASQQLRLALLQLTARGLIETTEGGDPL